MIWARRALGLLVVAGATVVVPVPAPSSARAEVTITRAELLERFRKVPGLYARFREEKRMALLAQPLVNEGTLHFHRGKLARHTKRPVKSSVVMWPTSLRTFAERRGRPRGPRPW